MLQLLYDTGPPSTSSDSNVLNSTRSKRKKPNRTSLFLCLCISVLTLIPICNAKGTATASFKPDSSVLATFSDTFENKDVELEKMVCLCD
jgi:hypothetical protein